MERQYLSPKLFEDTTLAIYAAVTLAFYATFFFWILLFAKVDGCSASGLNVVCSYCVIVFALGFEFRAMLRLLLVLSLDDGSYLIRFDIRMRVACGAPIHPRSRFFVIVVFVLLLTLTIGCVFWLAFVWIGVLLFYFGGFITMTVSGFRYFRGLGL
jgi:hypothetical protein